MQIITWKSTTSIFFFFRPALKYLMELELSACKLWAFCSGLLSSVLCFWCCGSGFGAPLKLAFESYGGCPKGVSVTYTFRSRRAQSNVAAVGLWLLPLTLDLIGSHKQKSWVPVGIVLGCSAPECQDECHLRGIFISESAEIHPRAVICSNTRLFGAACPEMLVFELKI